MIFTTLVEAISKQHPVALATVVRGPLLGAKLLLDEQGLGLGTLGDDELDGAVRAVALDLLDTDRSATQGFQTIDGRPVEVLIESYPAPPHLVIVGGVHIAIPLTDAAKLLGFRVTVVDPRTAFLTAERFPQADALVAEWPDEALPGLHLNRSTAVVILTHDPKLDNPATEVALRYPVRYLGAIGSHKTQGKRRETLREAGVSEADLARIHGPIGLPIGGVSPGEIAISILAEIIAVWRGKQD